MASHISFIYFSRWLKHVETTKFHIDPSTWNHFFLIFARPHLSEKELWSWLITGMILWSSKSVIVRKKRRGDLPIATLICSDVCDADMSKIWDIYIDISWYIYILFWYFWESKSVILQSLLLWACWMELRRASQNKGGPSTPMAWFVFVKKPAIWVTTCLSPQALVCYAHDWPLND